LNASLSILDSEALLLADWQGNTSMPFRSWSFRDGLHTIRLEVRWNIFGWTRARLFLDHHKVDESHGWFPRPLRGTLQGQNGQDVPIEATPCRTWLGLRVGRIFRVEIDLREVELVERSVHVERVNPWPDPLPPYLYWLLMPLFVPLLIVLILVFVLLGQKLVFLLLPLRFVHLLRYRRHKALIRHRLLAQERVLTWAALQEHLALRPSTLIEVKEEENKPGHLFWIDEDVLLRSPLVPDTNRQISPRTGNRLPFRVWCQQHYLSAETGRAALVEQAPAVTQHVTRGKDRKFFPLDRWRETYPLLRTVQTAWDPFPYDKDRPAYATALDLPDDKRLQTLLDLFLTATPPTRDLAVETLKLLGPDASPVIPEFTELLFHGPWSNREAIARALAEMGTKGVAVLLRAARCGDPSVSEPAFRALEMVQKGETTEQEENHGEVPAQPMLLTFPVHGVSSSSNEPASSKRPSSG